MVFLLPVNGQQAASKGKTDIKRADAKHGTSLQDAPSGVYYIYQPAPQDKGNGNTDEPKGYFCTLVAANNLPNFILAILGIVGIIVAICTLKNIERQSKAAEDAAEAALRNINMVLSKERARLNAGIGLYLQGETSNFVAPNEPLWVRVNNDGPTPAFRVTARFAVAISTQGDLSRKHFHSLNYDSKAISSILPNGGTEFRFLMTPSPSANDLNNLRSGAAACYVFGAISYTDIFDIKRVLRVGHRLAYVKEMEDWHLTDESEDNKEYEEKQVAN